MQRSLKMTEEISREIQTSRLAFKYAKIKILKLRRDYNHHTFISSVIHSTVYILNQKTTIFFKKQNINIFSKKFQLSLEIFSPHNNLA